MKILASYIVQKNTLISDSIKLLQDNEIKILVIVDKDSKLLGTITDGDIRRGLIKGVTINNYCSEIMNKKPCYALESDNKKIDKIIKIKEIKHPILLDSSGKVVGIYSELDLKRDKKENQVIIMAGGEGRRLMPLTMNTPKPLLKINSKPIISTIVDKFINAGFANISISVRYKSEMIIKFFQKNKYKGIVNFLKEAKPLGTAGCLSLIKKTKYTAPVIVINGDIITNINYDDLLNYHHRSKSLITLCVADYASSVPFGIVKVKNHKVSSIEEKPVNHYLINAGIYIIDQEVVKKMKDKGKIDMTDLINLYIKKNKVSVFPLHESWIDIGSHDDYKRAQNIY
tara:strand:+ start:4593 stop:5618 length:1026 start_codon:yes stop_codon:yes gene_type:complete